MPKVAPARVSRKALFKAALAVAEKTARQWAEDNGVTEGHLYAVLSGRESARLSALIDAFIVRYLPGRAA